MTWVVVNLVSPNRLGFKAFGFGFNPLLDGLPAIVDFLLPDHLGILPDRFDDECAEHIEFVFPAYLGEALQITLHPKDFNLLADQKLRYLLGFRWSAEIIDEF